MSKPAEIAAMVAATEKEFGALDILVNNAGIQHVANIEDFPVEKWDAVIAINLSSSFHTIRAAVPGMKKRKWGRIINIASAHGLVASAQKVAYVAAKHGLVGLTKVVAIEDRQRRHHLQRHLPGLGAHAAGAAADRRARQGVRQKRCARRRSRCCRKSSRCTSSPSRRASARWRCSCASDAAATITGSAYSIDGGWVAQ